MPHALSLPLEAMSRAFELLLSFIYSAFTGTITIICSGGATGQRWNSLGKPSFAVLVVALSFYHGLDG